MSTRPAKLRTPRPWEHPPLDHADIAAIRALHEGTADEWQQRHAWRVIRLKLCQCEKMSFWPGDEDGRRATDFAEGKRWVGNELDWITRLEPVAIDPRGEPPAMPIAPDDAEQQ